MSARREAETLASGAWPKETADRAWLWGYICALAPLNEYAEDSIFDHVVDSSGEAEALIKQARRDGAMRWSGLSGYVRRRSPRD